MSILLAVKVNIYSYVNQSHECRQNIAVGAIYREINPSPTVCVCEQHNRNGRPANVLGRRHRQITPRDATIHRARLSPSPLFRSRRTVPFDQRGTSQPHARPLDLTVHSRVRDPAARPPVMKSSIQDFGATACVHVSIVRLRPPAEGAEGADTAVRGAANATRTARWIHPGTDVHARSTT